MIPVLDLRYYGLTEYDNIHSRDGTSQTRLQWKDLGWYMQGKWIDNYLEGDVSVMNKDGNIVMSLQFSKGKLNGLCTFYKEGVRIQGTWKDGECVSKTIPWNDGSYAISYQHNMPNGCSAFYDASNRIRYSINYVNGARDRYFDWYNNELYVRDGEFETVGGYVNGTFLRDGVTRILKNSVLTEMAMYQNDNKTQVLCLFNGSIVTIVDSGGHKVYEGTDENQSIFPPTGNGTIFYNDKVVYKGDLKKGLAHGQGEYYYNRQLFYKGSFKYGLPHGYGILYGNNTQELFQFGYAITRNINIQDYFRQMHHRSICGDYMDSQEDILYTKVAQVFGDEYASDMKEYEMRRFQKPANYHNSSNGTYSPQPVSSGTPSTFNSPQPVSPRTPSAYNSPQPVSPGSPSVFNSQQPVSPSPESPRVSVHQGSGVFYPISGGQSTGPSSPSSSVYSQPSSGQSAFSQYSSSQALTRQGSFSQQPIPMNQQGLQVQLRQTREASQPNRNIRYSISDPTPNQSNSMSLSTEQRNDILSIRRGDISNISRSLTSVQQLGPAPLQQDELIGMINRTSTVKMTHPSSTVNYGNGLSELVGMPILSNSGTLNLKKKKGRTNESVYSEEKKQRSLSRLELNGTERTMKSRITHL